MRYVAIVMLLVGSIFANITAWADCGGCDKPPKDDKKVINLES